MVNGLHTAVACSSHCSSLLEVGARIAVILPKFANRLWDRNVHTCEIPIGTKGHVNGLLNNLLCSSGHASAVTDSVSNTGTWE